MVDEITTKSDTGYESSDTRFRIIKSFANYLKTHIDKFEEFGPDTKTSNLGYFSRPFRVKYENLELVLKLYTPVKDNSVATKIISNHENYIVELRRAGIRIPETVMFSRKTGNMQQVVIVQEAFRDEDLLRNRIINARDSELPGLCYLVFNDIVSYWKSKSANIEIGFHPTLRNYSVSNGVLFYFDTFPPMLFSQKELNRIIMTWSPYGGLLKRIIHPRLLNKVSDEYYYIDKMFAGVVGSCCRLRPDDAGKILAFSREFVSNSALLSDEEKVKINKLIIRPPRLSPIWLLIRKLSGNQGKPNI